MRENLVKILTFCNLRNDVKGGVPYYPPFEKHHLVQLFLIFEVYDLGMGYHVPYALNFFGVHGFGRGKLGRTVPGYTFYSGKFRRGCDIPCTADRLRQRLVYIS